MQNNYEAMLADEFARVQEMQASEFAQGEQLPQGVQVAALGGGALRNALREIKRINRPSTDAILDSVENAANPELSPAALDDIEAILKGDTEQTDTLEGRLPIATTDPVATQQETPFFEHKALSHEDILKASQSGEIPTDKRTPNRSYNIERHHEGARAAIGATFEQMQSADEFARVLDYIAEETGKRGSQTFDQIRANVKTDKDIFRELEPVFKGEQKGLLTAQQNYAARVLASSLFEFMKKEAANIKGGDDSLESMAGLAKTVEQLNFVVQYVANNATETGRALGAHRMIANSVKLGSLEDMSKALDSIGGVQDVKMQADLINNLVEIEEATGTSAASQFVGSLMRRVNIGTSAAAEYWRAQILTSPKTHLVNVGSSAMQLTWDNIARSLAAGIGETRKQAGKLIGKEVIDYASHQEALATLSSGFLSMGDSWRMATRAFVQNQGRFTKSTKGDEDNVGDFEMVAVDLGKMLFGDSGAQKAKVASDVALGAYRMLGAEDELGKAIGYRQELAGQAVRQAIKEGLTGDAMWNRAGQLIEQPTPEIHAVAMDAARRVTFQDEFDPNTIVGGFVKQTKRSVRKIPALGFLIPFIETPSNIGRRLVELSPLFPMSARWREEFAAGGARADVANAKAVMALGLSVAAWQMYDSGILTGSGPDKWDTKELLAKEGWQPNSLRIGETNYAIDRLSPFGQALMAIGTYRDQAKYAGSQEEMAEAFAMSTMFIAQNLTEMPFAQGFRDLLDFFSGEPYALKNAAMRVPSGFVPYSSLVKDLKDVADPTQRRISQDNAAQGGFIEGAWQHTKTRLPLVSFSMRPKRYWDGEPVIPLAGRVAYAISPVKTADTNKGKHDAVNMALLDNNFVPNEPNPIVSLAGVEFSLVELDSGEGKIFDEYIKRVGKTRRKLFTATIQSSGYKEDVNTGEGSIRYKLLSNAESNAQAIAFAEFVENDLHSLLQQSENLSAIGEEIKNASSPAGWVDEILKTYQKRIEADPNFEDSVRLRGKAKMLAPKNLQLNPLR